MADSLDVNFDVVDLAYNLLLFTTKQECMRAVAYGELEDRCLEKATERWAKSDEEDYLGFLMLCEGINVLYYGTMANDDNSLMENQNDYCNHESNEKDKMLENERNDKTFQQNSKQRNRNKTFKGMFRRFRSRKDKNMSTKKSMTKSASDQEIELSSLSCIPKTSDKSLKDSAQEHESNEGLDFFNNGFRVTTCEPELDLTATEDEEDNTTSVRGENMADIVPNGLHTKPQSLNRNMNLITTSRFLEARKRFQEIHNRLRSFSLGRRQVSLSNRLRFFRLAVACAMLMTVNNPKLGLDECKNLVGQFNSLKSVRCLVTKALEVPSGLRQRVKRKMCGQKWRKMLEKVHFVNFMFWRWIMLWKDLPRTGLELEIPVIDTDFGAVQPVDDWKLRDKCQTCVEFEQQMAHSCILAVNSKDQLILIDANNIVNIYTIEGKRVMSFRASTRRHPHSRWIIGLDDMDNIYIGSALGIRFDKERPLSVFSPAGRLVCEPELHGMGGKFNLYSVTGKGLILVLSVGATVGNVVSVHRQQERELVTSFRVREIESPRHFTTSKDAIIIGGTTSTESKEFAFQVFDQSGQQLYYFKPEVEFQTCAVDPWTGNILLANINKLRDYRYYMCDTVVLTGEIHILSQTGDVIQSGVKLRWPFWVVAGVTVLKCGLVALVTVNDPYYAIHMI